MEFQANFIVNFSSLGFNCTTNSISVFLLYLQTLDFDREGLTKLKKAVKAIHNSGNSKYIIIYVFFFNIQSK